MDANLNLDDNARFPMACPVADHLIQRELGIVSSTMPLEIASLVTAYANLEVDWLRARLGELARMTRGCWGDCYCSALSSREELWMMYIRHLEYRRRQQTARAARECAQLSGALLREVVKLVAGRQPTRTEDACMSWFECAVEACVEQKLHKY